MTVNSNYLDELNPQQRAAVEFDGGASLVIAGAGSGKTRVLTYKIVHLLNNGVEPYRILALTFTNKAAREMRERIEKMVGEKTASKLWMGTFHSIFLRILRVNADRLGFKSNFTIYDASDSRSLIKSIIKEKGLDDKIYKPQIVQSAISTAKNALISPEMYYADSELRESDRRARRPLIHEIYSTYRARCFVAGAMDFDDLLYFTNILMKDNPDILTHYQEFFKYILVDEYQDTNFAQHLIISRLSEHTHRFCVVGDDAQSIYSFRGANIKNILNLKKTYPDLRIFKLEQNYRSTQSIINAANSLIEKNTQQIRKKIFSRNQVGSGIEVASCVSDLEEGYVVVNRLRELRRRCGDSFNEFAILYRTNAQSRILEEQLRKANIDYAIYGGLSFYQRKEIKDAISYFRLSVNPDDDEALRRVLNVPARGIGETTQAKLLRKAIDSEVSIWHIISHPGEYADLFNAGTWRKLDGFRKMIGRFNEAVEAGLDANQITEKILVESTLISSLLTDSTPENITRRENLEELSNGVRQFVQNTLEQDVDADVSMEAFLNTVSLATDQDMDEGSGERVTLMTVHASKGLEFNNVFIVGVEDELFPSALSRENVMQVEEERRLLYVAITRAKNFCMMTYAKSRYRNGQPTTTRVSPFLYDIDPAFLNFVSGTELRRPSRQVNPIENYRNSFHSPVAGRKTDFASWRGDSSRAASSVANRRVASNISADYTLHRADELSEGMIIEHNTFGRGRIERIDDHLADAKIHVAFENTDPRSLLLKFARFKIVENR